MKTIKPSTPLLSLKPAPTPLQNPLTEERDIDAHRALYCRHYDPCLLTSARNGWVAFSCTQCPLRELAPRSPGSEPFAQQRREATLTE